MKLILLFITLFTANTWAQNSQYKGWEAVTKELSTRLAPAGKELEMYSYIPAEGLQTLLGTWNNFGSEHVFQNGNPNPVNVLIWYAALSEFTKDMGASCATPKLKFNREFLGALNKICDWPKAGAMTETVMLNYWLGVMGYNAPEAEYVEWRDFFLQSGYKTKPAKDTIAAMTLAITMNPYFLLNR